MNGNKRVVTCRVVAVAALGLYRTAMTLPVLNGRLRMLSHHYFIPLLKCFGKTSQIVERNQTTFFPRDNLFMVVFMIAW